MRVKRLGIINIRSLNRADCIFGNVNFIFGKNAEGKSTVIHSLEYALTNKSAISSDINVLQKTGTSECSVAVEVDGIGTIQRYKKTANQMNRLNGEKSTDKEIMGQIASVFGLSYETIGIMFDAAKFTKMDKKQQKAFLLKLTGISLNADKVIEYMDNPSDKAKDKVRNEIKEIEISIDDIASLYKTFYSARGQKKKDVAESENSIKVLSANAIKDKPRDIQYIKNDMERISLAIKEIEKTLTIANERTKQKTTLEESLAKGRENYKTVESRLNSDIPKTKEYVEQLESEMTKLNNDKTLNSKNLGTFENIVKNAKNKLITSGDNSSIDEIMNDSNILLVEDITPYESTSSNDVVEKSHSMKTIEGDIKRYSSLLKSLGDSSSLDDILNSDLTLVDDIDKKLDENRELEGRKNDNALKKNTLTINISNAKDTLTKINTTTCPLYAGIVCNYDKKPMIEEFNSNIKKWEKELDDIELNNKKIANAIINNIKAIIKTLITRFNLLKRECKKIAQEDIVNSKTIIKYYQTKIVSINENNQKIDETIKVNSKKKQWIEWLLNASRELEVREKELKDIQIPNVDGLLEKKKKLDEEKIAFEQEKKFAEKYLEEQKLIEKKKKEYEILKEDLELYEYLVIEFAPNGVRSRILSKIIAPIVEEANERLDILAKGYKLEFDFDKDFDIYVTNKTGRLLFEHLSVSEQLRISIIIQDAINQLTNVGLMVIDEAGILDNDNFIMLMDLIKEIAPYYGNIFVVATKTKDDIVALSESIYSTSDDVKVFFVENNEVHRM